MLKEPSQEDVFFNAVKNSFENDYIFTEILLKAMTSKAKSEAERLKRQATKGFVYFLFDEKFIKIGKTKNNPAKRSNMLKCGNPAIKLVGYIETNNCDLLEKQLHERYSKFRVKGEWFKLKPSTVKLLVHKNYLN